MKILNTISIWNELMADKRTRNVKEYEHKVEGKDLWPIRSLLLSVCWVNDTSCRYPTIPLELRDPAFHEQPAEITNPYPLYFCPKESEYSTGRACSKAQGLALVQYREELHSYTPTATWEHTGHLKTPRTVSHEDFINRTEQVKFPSVQ